MPSGDDHQHESESLIQRRTHHRAEKVDYASDGTTDAEEECAMLLKNGSSNSITPRNAPPKIHSESSRKGGFCCKNLALLLLVGAVFWVGRHSAPLLEETADPTGSSAGSSSSMSTGTMIRKGDKAKSSTFTLPKRDDATKPTSNSESKKKQQPQQQDDKQQTDDDLEEEPRDNKKDTNDDSAEKSNEKETTTDQFPKVVLDVPRNVDQESPFLWYHKQHLEPAKRDFLSSAGKPEYGDISYTSIQKQKGDDDTSFYSRKIDQADDEQYQEQRAEFIHYMDKHDLRSREKYDPYDDLDFPRECTRPQWTWHKRPNCLSVHDLSYDRVAGGRPVDNRHSNEDDKDAVVDPHQFYHIHYLSHGAFRDSFLFEPADGGSAPFVTKTKIFERDLDNRDLCTCFHACASDRRHHLRLTPLFYVSMFRTLTAEYFPPPQTRLELKPSSWKRCRPRMLRATYTLFVVPPLLWNGDAKSNGISSPTENTTTTVA